ncbi:MAG: arylesterase [Deltaproteobacteria bacterium]|jgi:lysophospholipase L1-like esterase|nr:arylesterase [Deltaproteobacteria bacterium]
MKKIVCHGDSLTEAADLGKGYVWTTLVENRLGLEIINSGIGGDTSGGLLSRFYPDAIQHQPDMIMIMAGTNDLWWNLEINTIQANIYAMACQARHHDIIALVGLPPPILSARARKQDFMAPAAGYANLERKLSKLVKALALSAKESDIACIDFYHLFFDKKGKVSPGLFLEDGLHPNAEGNRIMAASTVEHLQELFFFA